MIITGSADQQQLHVVQVQQLARAVVPLALRGDHAHGSDCVRRERLQEMDGGVEPRGVEEVEAGCGVGGENGDGWEKRGLLEARGDP